MSDIEKLRIEMEKITADMLKLLKSRTDIAKEIGDLKNKQGRVVSDESSFLIKQKINCTPKII